MRKTIKKVAIVIMATAMLLGAFAALAACTSKEDETVGQFYTLREAYDEGLLTVYDLENIAYYYQGNEKDDFLPMPIEPEELNEETIKKIKQTRLQEIKQGAPQATINDIFILEYYGTYNDCIAVIVDNNFGGHGAGIRPEYIVGGVVFYDYSAPEIMVWKEKIQEENI